MGESVVEGTRQVRRKRAQVAGKGGFGSGLLFLVGGLLLRGHFQPLKDACASGAGQFSQALSTSAQQQCGTDSFLAELGTVLIVFGALLLGLALLGVVILLIEARSPSAAVPASSVAPAAPSRSWLSPVLRAQLLRRAPIGLAALGLLSAVFLTYDHYHPAFSCASCAAGLFYPPYAYIVGIPVALLGTVGYGLILGALLWPGTALERRVGLLIAAGLVFTLYLNGRELFGIHQVCEVCLPNLVCMSGLAVLALLHRRQRAGLVAA